jgi:hypothetical protein
MASPQFCVDVEQRCERPRLVVPELCLRHVAI